MKMLRTVSVILALGFSSAAQTPSPLPSYPNTPAGLEQLIGTMLSLQQQGRSTELAAYASALVLPHANEWFAARFGMANCKKQPGENDCIGPRLAITYEAKRAMLPASLALTLQGLAAEGLTQLEAVNAAQPCTDPLRLHASDQLMGDLTTVLALPALRGREPVYVVWAYNEHKETILAFFIYAEDAFRFIGMQYPAPPADYIRFRDNDVSPEQESKPSQVRLERVEMKSVAVDPALVDKTVLLSVLVDRSGKPKEITYVRGPEKYKNNAIAQVQKRKFDPPSFGAGGFHPNSFCLEVVGQH